MASDSEEDQLSPENISFSTTFSISLTTQKTTPPKAGSKAAAKVTKDTKTKETKFSVNKDNYLDFLKLLLSKHSEKRYKISERNIFSFKYICPPARKYVHVTFWYYTKLTVAYIFSKSDSIDVDDQDEYKDMVSKILKKKPKKVTIMVEMADVKKSCQKAQVICSTLIVNVIRLILWQNDSDNSGSEKGNTEDEVTAIFSSIYILLTCNPVWWSTIVRDGNRSRPDPNQARKEIPKRWWQRHFISL